jgi:hypothetical protein
MRKINPHADTAYVFNVARIVVPKECVDLVQQLCPAQNLFTDVGNTNGYKQEARFLQSPIDGPHVGRAACRICGETRRRYL